MFVLTLLPGQVKHFDQKVHLITFVCSRVTTKYKFPSEKPDTCLLESTLELNLIDFLGHKNWYHAIFYFSIDLVLKQQ